MSKNQATESTPPTPSVPNGHEPTKWLRVADRIEMNTVKTRYRGTAQYIHVLAELVRAAHYRGVTTY
jgi:hypothetical protein